MSQNTLQLDKILHNALNLLSKEKNIINNLNVFPVPDGDTGLNMTLTLQGALNSLRAYNIETLSIHKYIEYFMNGILFSSRGCSGVIFASFCKGMGNSLVAEASFKGFFSNEALSNAFKNGYKLAFNETINPKEGTILTMMRVLSECFDKFGKNDINFLNVLKRIIPYLEETLEKTPEMLPVLKKAGVVDSGAMAFLVLIKGVAIGLEYNKSIIKPLMNIANVLLINRYIHSFVKRKKYGKRNRLVKTIISNLPHDNNNINNVSFSKILKQFENFIQKGSNRENAQDIIKETKSLNKSWNPNIQYRYCTEFILEGKLVSKHELKSRLSKWGDSIFVIESEDSYKIHIHTNKPKIVLKFCANYGRISSTKIDDMKKQHHSLISEDKSYYDKDKAVLVIVNGEGFAEILKGLGVTDLLIYKKIKPSVNQILKALAKTRAKNIIVAADDKDISPALKSAITLCKSNVELVGTEDVISIIRMMYYYSNAFDVIQNARVMRENLNKTKFCKIVRAIRDFKKDSLFIKRGDFFTIYRNKILLSFPEIDKTISQSISNIRENENLITFYIGKMQKDGNKILSNVKAEFNGVDFEIYNGGQDRYNFYITFE